MIGSLCALADDYDDDGSEIQTQKLLYWSRYCPINHFKTIEHRKVPKHTNTRKHSNFILMQQEDEWRKKTLKQSKEWFNLNEII